MDTVVASFVDVQRVRVCGLVAGTLRVPSANLNSAADRERCVITTPNGLLFDAKLRNFRRNPMIARVKNDYIKSEIQQLTIIAKHVSADAIDAARIFAS